MTATIEIHLKKLHAAQREVYDSQARFTVLACGRRFGKTDLGSYKLTNSVISTDKPYGYVVPTHDDFVLVWDAFRDTLHDLIREENKQSRRLVFLTGASIRFYSAEAVDRMRGNKFAGVIIDEAAAIANLEYAWTRAIMPTLADLSGWAWFLSSFRGKNYFYQLYTWGIDPLKALWRGFSFPTSANPYIAASEIELARSTLPKRAFNEEYLAVPDENYGSVFRGVLDVATAHPGTAYDGDFIMGVDFARDYDFTVCAVFDKNTRRMVAMDRFNEVNWTIQRGRIEALARQWRVQAILAESNSIGSVNIEELQKAGLPVHSFTTTMQTKQELIDALALAIEQRDIALLNDPLLIHEMQAYEMQRSPAGNIKFGAPSGSHDDIVMAVALANFVMRRSRIQLYL